MYETQPISVTVDAHFAHNLCWRTNENSFCVLFIYMVHNFMPTIEDVNIIFTED
jgi:hypothetical protein